MKKFLTILSFTVLICLGQIASVKNSTVLTWKYPEKSSTNTFIKVYRTTNPPSSSVRSWEIVKILQATNTQIIIPNLGTNKNYYMVSCSNVWGETMFFTPEFFEIDYIERR